MTRMMTAIGWLVFYWCHLRHIHIVWYYQLDHQHQILSSFGCWVIYKKSSERYLIRFSQLLFHSVRVKCSCTGPIVEDWFIVHIHNSMDQVVLDIEATHNEITIKGWQLEWTIISLIFITQSNYIHYYHWTSEYINSTLL